MPGFRWKVRCRRINVEAEGHNYEIGADYELRFGPGRLKMIALNRSAEAPREENVNVIHSDGSPTSGSRFTSHAESRELIGRTEYRWNRHGGEWQVSAEAAFNSLDSASRLFVLNPNGTYGEIPLPGATARVDEERYEVMGTYGRSPLNNLKLLVSLGGEYSELKQVGIGGQTRSFVRPKGLLSAGWQPTPRTDLNVRLQRRVGQLNFYDFLASVNLRDDTETAANPDLVPAQRWDLDVEGVRRFGEFGTTTLRLFAALIDDIIDIIPIGETGQSPGNLDHATAYGVESRSTFNLDRLGWRGARLDTVLIAQRTELEDPLTGETRPISNSTREAASLSLRHDVPATDWAWGSQASYQYNARAYRLTEVGRQWEGPVWVNLFLEHKNVFGLSVTATASNLLGSRSMWDRVVYEGRRHNSDVAFIENRDRRIGPIFSFSVRGKF